MPDNDVGALSHGSCNKRIIEATMQIGREGFTNDCVLGFCSRKDELKGRISTQRIINTVFIFDRKSPQHGRDSILPKFPACDRRSSDLSCLITPRFRVGHEKRGQRMGFSPDEFWVVLAVLQTLLLFCVRSLPKEDYEQRG
ncbi:hypothetical protein DR864_11625 [Runella rosea]|uniref:Uncharacterized protein n=1 Tax=Runella rosea TaxID=2259595 RepID=A0A344TI81_9BACT|nr:hypothetical protein DR864_11625 [Runella rosea]